MKTKQKIDTSEKILFCLFYSTVFIAFGFGALLAQIIKDNFVSGGWFIAVGFIILIVGYIIDMKDIEK